MTQDKAKGLSENWAKPGGNLARKAAARKFREKMKEEGLNKAYIRIPHPTLKNTFILKEKK